MNDSFIFLFGCFVSLIVASSVGLLLWGASNEPEDGELPNEEQQGQRSVRVYSSDNQKVG